VQDYGERGPPIHSKGFASRFRLPFRSANPAAPPTWAQCRARPQGGARRPQPGKPRGPPLPSPRDCFGPLRNGSGPRNDGVGFLPIVTSEGRERLAM